MKLQGNIGVPASRPAALLIAAGAATRACRTRRTSP